MQQSHTSGRFHGAPCQNTVRRTLTPMTGRRRNNPFLRAAIRRGFTPTASSARLPAEAEQAGEYRGYYMKVGSLRASLNYWIGHALEDARRNIERAGDLFLSDATGYDYDIEYSFGVEASDGSPWANLSSCDSVVL